MLTMPEDQETTKRNNCEADKYCYKNVREQRDQLLWDGDLDEKTKK